MHGMKKRFLAILMTLAMAIGFTTSVFAAEPADVLSTEPTAVATEAAVVSEEASTRASIGKVLAAGAATINGGIGSLDVTLPSGNFWADLVVQIDYISSNSLVTISVRTPDGDVISLGSISGSGSRTNSYELVYASAGTYTFYFASTASSFDVTAFIYD